MLVATAPYPLRSALVSREEHQGKSLPELDGLLQQAMIENIQALAQQARQTPDVPAILIGHFSVNEASHGSEQNIMIGRDAALPRSVLADPAWRYVALGHIHKHQSLNGDHQPPVLYTGSIERIDFGEEHEPKGFVVAEIGDGPTTWEFMTGYKRQARPFVTVRVDARDAPDPTEPVLAAIRECSDLTETVVRVIIKLRPDQEALLDDREIRHLLEGAYFVASHPERRRARRAPAPRRGLRRIDDPPRTVVALLRGQERARRARQEAARTRRRIDAGRGRTVTPQIAS